MPRQVLLALALSFAVGSCGAQPGPWVELKGQRFQVELADTDPARQRGLMQRESLASDRGMLFVFEREAPQAFWMKNTLIPLDILYFDQERRLVSISRDVPPCKSALCPSYPSAGPAKYVLELNAGAAAELGIARGDRIEFSPEVPATGRR